MLEYMNQQSTMWVISLGVYIAVSAIESFAAAGMESVPVSERLLNVSAGALFLIGGGYLAFLVLTELAQLRIFRPSELNAVLYVVLFVLLQDFVYYFYHRLQHSWSLLWGIHKLHHTDGDVNITTSHRTHILEQPIQALLIVIPALLFLGYHPTGTLVGLYAGMVFLYFSHARLNVNLGPLGRVFVGPRFHRVHHSIAPEHMNKNFAQFFSFMDWLFGTYSESRPIYEVKTGVANCHSARDRWSPIVWPLSSIQGGTSTVLTKKTGRGNAGPVRTGLNESMQSKGWLRPPRRRRG